MIAHIDPETQERRSGLLARLYPMMIAVEVDAPSELDAKLDLASVLFACGLGIAADAMGPAGLVEHLERLLEEWRARARHSGAQVGGRGVH